MFYLEGARATDARLEARRARRASWKILSAARSSASTPLNDGVQGLVMNDWQLSFSASAQRAHAA
jgi:hypothetical protein